MQKKIKKVISLTLAMPAFMLCASDNSMATDLGLLAQLLGVAVLAAVIAWNKNELMG